MSIEDLDHFYSSGIGAGSVKMINKKLLSWLPVEPTKVAACGYLKPYPLPYSPSYINYFDSDEAYNHDWTKDLEYDLIIIAHVFEYKPADLLNKLVNSLASGGFIIILIEKELEEMIMELSDEIVKIDRARVMFSFASRLFSLLPDFLQFNNRFVLLRAQKRVKAVAKGSEAAEFFSMRRAATISACLCAWQYFSYFDYQV